MRGLGSRNRMPEPGGRRGHRAGGGRAGGGSRGAALRSPSRELRAWVIGEMGPRRPGVGIAPIVDAGENSANEHYDPCPMDPGRFRPGTCCWWDLWAKEPAGPDADQTWMASIRPPSARVQVGCRRRGPRRGNRVPGLRHRARACHCAAPIRTRSRVGPGAERGFGSFGSAWGGRVIPSTHPSGARCRAQSRRGRALGRSAAGGRASRSRSSPGSTSPASSVCGARSTPSRHRPVRSSRPPTTRGIC
jgi:hypothetical protein